MHQPPNLIIGLLPLVVLAIVVVASMIYMRRTGYVAGPIGTVVVRCRAGHLFTTIWIPFMSFKAIRLGPIRYQFCPVGNHWAFVDLVNESDLTEAEKQFADEHHDSQVP